MEDVLTDFFNGNDFSYTVWRDKYALKDDEGNLIETNPDQTIRRVAKQFAEIEKRYPNPLSENEIYEAMKGFKCIIPGGSVLSGCGSKTPISLSNCFVIDSPKDSYDSIMNTRNKQVQLMKRRGGVGVDISELRPRGASVNNAAITSTGAASFMDGFSAITKEVAQNGRRGALMLTMNVEHPDIEEFISVKQDLTKVTGANISVKISDEFMKAVEDDKDFILRFPCDIDIANINPEEYEYGKLVRLGHKEYIKRVKATDIWNLIVHCAWNTAEPGVIFVDRMHKYAPDECYEGFRMISTNPCVVGETKVAVADGRGYVSIKELADKGDDVPVFCLNDKGKLCVSLMRNPRITGYDEDIYEIEIEGGHKIKCTGNHKILLNGGGYVEAKDIKEGDSLFLLTIEPETIKEEFEKKMIFNNQKEESEQKYYAVKGKKIQQIQDALRNGYKIDIVNDEVYVLRRCENCGKEFKIPYDRREVAFCSSECSAKYNEVYKWRNAFSSKTIEEIKETQKVYNHKVISVRLIGKDNVYNGTVDNYHNFFIGGFEENVNGRCTTLSINNLQCGEIGMGGGDSCRLIAVNLASIIDNPYAQDEDLILNASKLADLIHIACRLGDDLVDMEIDAVNRILSTIGETEETERKIWQHAIDVGRLGRRTGIGFLGLADMLAMIGVKYDSEEGKRRIENIMRFILFEELWYSITLAQERGAFPIFDAKLEKEALENGNEFFAFIKQEFPKQWEAMQKYGRRNISWSTVAPTGTISNLAQVTSGIEPLFFPFYERKKKCMKETDRVDYVDKVGEKFTTYIVVHQGLKNWAHIAKGIPFEEMEDFNVDKWQEI